MTHGISTTVFSELSDFLASRIGLHFPHERWPDLERRIRSAALDLGFTDVELCIRQLLASPLKREQLEVLAAHLTVGETYFFREGETFDALREHILPELIGHRRAAGRRLRIWSVGCATGEEPYSIAILLSQMIPDFEHWNVTILATDINARFLRKASEGVYREWSFRCTPKWVQDFYFTKTGEGGFEVLPRVQKMVAFGYLNLAEDTYPALHNHTNAMDVIFCRNVLMYFTPERAREVVARLYRSLVEGGWLIVGSCEASAVPFSRFALANFPGATLYQKDSRHPQRAEVVESRMEERPTFLLPPSWLLAGGGGPEIGVISEPDEAPSATPEDLEEGDARPTRYQEALTLYELGSYEETAANLLLWLTGNQNDAKAMALLARVSANRGELVQALEWCEKAIAADKLNAGWHYLRATILQEQGSAEEARASLKRTLYLDPDFVLAHVALGSLTRRQGKVHQSAKHFENALSLLRAYRQEDVLAEAEGMTVGRLSEIIQSTMRQETAA